MKGLKLGGRFKEVVGAGRWSGDQVPLYTMGHGINLLLQCKTDIATDIVTDSITEYILCSW